MSRRYTTQVSNRASPNLYQDKWEAIIGLEIHAQISSKTKLFSTSSTSFNEPANTNVSVIDAAFPGTIPKLNSKCVDLAVATSLALSGNVQLISMFDRKQYFYPDLPAAPISIGGKLMLTHLDDLDYETEVRIKQIQLEQDTGKSIHDVRPVMALIDLNRAGIGLMEIVTEPDIRASREAGLTLRKLQSILRAVGSSDGNMEEGSLRCDANVSIHEPGTPFGTRCEIKNLNSVKFLMAAIDVEIKRQVNELRNGNPIIPETRGYNVAENKTFKLRTKETITDYRITHELYGLLHSKNIKFAKNPVSVAQLGSIIDCIRIGEISGKIGKLVLGKMVSGDRRLAPEIIQENDWKQITDINALELICRDILSQNPENVKLVKEGNQNTFTWFVGQVMKKTKGKANPQLTNELLKKLLQ
ncbi:14836_t:CDS:10 [Acaulospora colombiana]|uniref:14836_t:CDS:1 n=1 Tax=Acaulospora colombiana TaxID=27376 RepID=A0ACA9LLK9_9GLOM|nr:14836_t:CDS:10 [Acaulospora colombiana]